MEKDIRYESVKVLIETGRIQEFQQIFNYLPKSILAHDLGTNNNRMTRLINNVDQFTLEELFRISHLLGVKYKTILNIVHNQYFEEQKRKKKIQ
jgi:plasmid maintenance system antidote protein VapI